MSSSGTGGYAHPQGHEAQTFWTILEKERPDVFISSKGQETNHSVIFEIECTRTCWESNILLISSKVFKQVVPASLTFKKTNTEIQRFEATLGFICTHVMILLLP
jgi:hypothetical protein